MHNYNAKSDSGVNEPSSKFIAFSLKELGCFNSIGSFKTRFSVDILRFQEWLDVDVLGFENEFCILLLYFDLQTALGVF